MPMTKDALPLWSAHAMPREKLQKHGVQALDDTELLALLLRTGLKGKPVKELAAEILNTFGGLAGLFRADQLGLRAVKGLGPAKGSELIAVMELAKRGMTQSLRQQPVFQRVDAVAEYLQVHLGMEVHEVFAVLFLDAQHRLIAYEPMFRGTLTQTSVYQREVVLRALQLHAHAVVLAHNHPSGSLHPSAADVNLTHTLRQALALIDVTILDHVIVGPNGHSSMQSQGLL